MTVVTAETRLVSSGVALLPRVNLLPPEIAEQATFRKVQMGLGAAVLGAVGIVGLLVVGAAGGVSDAQTSLDSASAENTSLQQKTVKYKDVTAVYAKAETAQAQLGAAMGDEVRYSQLLNDLSLSVPSTVWLKGITYAAAPATSVTATSGLPGFSVDAVAFSHDDVALWLESVARLKTYANPYFSSSAEELLGTRKVVVFKSTATLTPAALSGRYNKPVGG